MEGAEKLKEFDSLGFLFVKSKLFALIVNYDDTVSSKVKAEIFEIWLVRKILMLN